MKNFYEWIESSANHNAHGVPHYSGSNTSAIRNSPPETFSQQPQQPRMMSGIKVGTRFRFSNHPDNEYYHQLFGANTEGTITAIGGTNVSYKMDSENGKRTAPLSKFGQNGLIDITGSSEDFVQQQSQEIITQQKSKQDRQSLANQKFQNSRMLEKLKVIAMNAKKSALTNSSLNSKMSNIQKVELMAASQDVNNFISQYNPEEYYGTDLETIKVNLLAMIKQVAKGKFNSTYKWKNAA